jgi:hypothetical protein
MKKILRTTIVCLLIPSFVFAQIPQYRGNEPSVKQTDLARVLNALNTDVGQQIVSYTETTVGNIDIEHAKAFTTDKDEIAFVPIKSYSKILAALCYRQLEDGSEYLFLLTYNAAEKGVSFTFPSGRMQVMKSRGVTESANPDFQFQEYNDLNNNVKTTDIYSIIELLCGPVGALIIFYCCSRFCNFDCVRIMSSIIIVLPLLFIVPAYLFQNSNLEVISILFAVYIEGCVFAILSI